MATDISTVGVFIAVYLLIDVDGYANKVFKYFSMEKSWIEARTYCQEQNGDLATIQNFYEDDFNKIKASLEDSRTRKSWVAGRIIDLGWNWYDLEWAGSLIPMAKLIGNKGCFHSSRIIGGVRIPRMTPEKCFRKCDWNGAVALKKFYCICERNLRNLSQITTQMCDTTCAGSQRDKCGGPLGVSVYQINHRAVLWGKDEPKLNSECVYVKRYHDKDQWRWFSLSCDMRLKYMCRYDEHNICGVQPNCIRPSTTPATWEGAVKACRRNNATIAVVDVTMMYENKEVISLPPGEFWVGLRKRSIWKWSDGSIIPDSKFHGGRGKPCSDDKCTVLQKTSYVRLNPEQCDVRRPFICEFLFMYYTKLYPTSTTHNSALPYGSNVKWSQTENTEDTNVIVKEVKERGRNDTSHGSTDSKEDMYKSVMFIAIGVAVGMAFVFSICVIVYIARRCRKQMKWKTRKGYHHRRDNFAVCSVSNQASLRSSESTNIEHEVLYDIPCDTQSESPFRRTQRVLRQESLREMPPALLSRGSDGYRSGSWRRINNGSQKEMSLKERQINNPEIRCVYPINSSERTFRDASYVIHKAQCHGMLSNENGSEYCQPEVIEDARRSTGDAENDDIQLAETYSQPGNSRKASTNESLIHVDTSDLYACVQRAMTRLSEDRLDQISDV